MRNKSWLAVSLLLLLTGCGPSPDASSGADLAKIYCSGCHIYPGPELLPKSQWENVLPRMGARLGIQSETFDPFEGKSMQEKFQLQSMGIYPETAQLSNDQWANIQTYFLQKAPDTLEHQTAEPWPQQQIFSESFPEIALSGFPALTLMEVDTQSHMLYLSDWNGNFMRLNDDFTLEDRTLLPKPLIDIERSTKDRLMLLSIGQLYPNDSKSGALVEIGEQTLKQQSLLFSQLRRPVHFTTADLDGDQQEDVVICAFGNMMGNLSWYKKRGNSFEEHVISIAPGATRVHAEDLDANGFIDLVVLFAQGDEGVSIFYNEGGSFREEKVLRFHPLFGSNDFEFLDFNQDGHKDIILSNGDNGDHSNVLKPYHGVRIFLNNGQQAFSEQYFFPFPGASKVKSRDFDGDGDLDMVLMSFFPDYGKGGSQSLVYLENKGNWQFEPQSLKHADEGRWMLMEAADLDKDGDEDVLIGSFVLNSEEINPKLLARWQQSNKRILYLENQQIP